MSRNPKLKLLSIATLALIALSANAFPQSLSSIEAAQLVCEDHGLQYYFSDGPQHARIWIAEPNHDHPNFAHEIEIYSFADQSAEKSRPDSIEDRFRWSFIAKLDLDESGKLIPVRFTTTSSCLLDCNYTLLNVTLTIETQPRADGSDRWMPESSIACTPLIDFNFSRLKTYRPTRAFWQRLNDYVKKID